MRVYVATTNAGKLREFRSLLAPHVDGVESFPGYAAPAEGETSYAENAALKAHALRSQLRAAGISGAVIADDSGLEIAALGGAPGVMTARFGGEALTWAQRRAHVLERLAGVPAPQRAARFVCTVHLIDAGGSERHALGEVEGSIAGAELGEAGFSFDSIFYYPPAHRTFAQLSEEEKHRVSHRGRAVARLFGGADA